MNEPLKHQVNDVACSQLEKSWFANEPVKIETCLEGLPEEELAGTSEELICIEMEFLWKQWERAAATRLKSNQTPLTPTSVEEYLQRFPQLDSLQHLERLASEEIRCRLQVGDRVNPTEYVQRFPKLAAESSLMQDRLNTLQQQHDTGHEEQTMVARSPSGQSDETGYGQAAIAEGTLHGNPAGPQAKDTYIGKELGGYKILNEVGRGGMGVVYKAFDTKLKRIVALKVLRNMVHSDAAELDRFLGEATAAAQMDHPNIISVFEIEKDAEAPFVVLEFASGGALNDRIDGTPFVAEKAAQLILTLAEAIHAAHEKGIVHRDLKPGNVVFTGNDEVKITDFGLAKWIDEASDLTKSGEMVGTPSYMAPEQVAGKSGVITARTDVYALGVILYELLTGRPPFTGSSSINTVLHVMEDDPVPPNKLQSEIGHDLNTICLKCLEKPPEKRYETAAQLAGDLQAYLEDRPITARRPSAVERSRKWIRRHPATSGFLAVATMVVLALIYTGIKVNQRLQVERDKAQENANVATAQGAEATNARKVAENEKIQAETARNVAQQEKEKADQARTEAQENELRAVHAQYVNSISLSQQELEASNFDGAMARLKRIKTNSTMDQHRQFEMEILESVNKGAYFKLPPDDQAQFRALERFAVHPEQQLAVTGSDQGHINLWNLQTRSLLHQIRFKIPVTIKTLQWLSADKLFVASTSSSENGGGAYILSLQPADEKQFTLVVTGQLWDGNVDAATVYVDHLQATEPSANSSSPLKGRLVLATMSTDSKTPVTPSISTLHFLDLQSGNQLQQFAVNTEIYSLAFDSDGAKVAVGTDNELLLYTRKSKENSNWEQDKRFTFSRDLAQNKRAIKSVVFWQPNSTPFILSAGHDHRIRAWNLNTGEQEFELIGHQSMVQSISLDSAAGKLASASNDRMIIVWDLDERKIVTTFDEHEAELTQVRFLENGRKLLSVSWDGRLIVRDLDPFHPNEHDLRGIDMLNFATNASQTEMVVVGKNYLGLWSLQGTVRPLNKQALNPSNDSTPNDPLYRSVIALPNDAGWLVGDRSSMIHHYVRQEDELVEILPARKSKNLVISDLAMHPDGKRFISVGRAKAPREQSKREVELWNLENLEPTTLATFDYDLLAVAIDSSGQYIAYAGDTHQQGNKNSLFVRNLETQESYTLEHQFPRHIFDLQFQPGTLALAAVGDSNAVSLFWGPGWPEETIFYGHNYYVVSVAFSTNGQRLISGGNGGSLRIWDVERGNPLLVLPVPNSRSGRRFLLLEKQKKILSGYKNLYSWDYATPDKLK